MALNLRVTSLILPYIFRHFYLECAEDLWPGSGPMVPPLGEHRAV